MFGQKWTQIYQGVVNLVKAEPFQTQVLLTKTELRILLILNPKVLKAQNLRIEFGLILFLGGEKMCLQKNGTYLLHQENNFIKW